MKFSLGTTLFVLVFAMGISAASEGRFSGYMIGDYYWIAAHHDSTKEGKNGFWFRRIYFTYDQDLADAFSVRLRYEMASDGSFGTSANKHNPYIKDAYLKWKYSKNHQLIVGISPTPTWGVLEDFWGYRSIEKTLLDIQNWSSSRDFGLALKGSLLEDGKVKYHFMAANGSGEKNEINAGKKIFGSLSYYLSKNLFIELYADHNDNVHNKTYAYWNTLQGFLGYENESFRLGLQAARQNRKPYGKEEFHLDAASVFAIYKVSKQISLFGRIDKSFNANPEGDKISYLPFDNSAGSTLFIAGLDYSPADGVHFMPNIELTTYNENNAGVTPASDVVPRVTFFYMFKENKDKK
jgi:hypothetical protein